MAKKVKLREDNITLYIDNEYNVFVKRGNKYISPFHLGLIYDESEVEINSNESQFKGDTECRQQR